MLLVGLLAIQKDIILIFTCINGLKSFYGCFKNRILKKLYCPFDIYLWTYYLTAFEAAIFFTKTEKAFLMKNKKILARTFLSMGIIIIMFAAWSCSKDEVDDEPPVINMNESHHYPQACDTVYVGETFTFMATFTDNQELGAYSIDIHHNFDHHSHSTEAEECEPDPPKTPTEDVFLFIQSYTISEGLTTYEAEVNIEIPANADTGDYHFFVALTDKEGWQTIRGVGIKVRERE